MASFLVFYGTGEGQTATVAERIVDVLVERGHDTTGVDAEEAPSPANSRRPRRPTPLQRELDAFGRTLGIGAVALAVPLLLIRETLAVQAALTATSLAMAAVSEVLGNEDSLLVASYHRSLLQSRYKSPSPSLPVAVSRCVTTITSESASRFHVTAPVRWGW